MEPQRRCTGSWKGCGMSDAWPAKPVEPRIAELGKSTLPAGLADDQGAFPFYCSSPQVRRIDCSMTSTPSILMGTGGVATVHLGRGEFSYSTDTWAFTVSGPCTDIAFLYRQLEHRLPQIDYAGFGGSGLRHLNKEYIRRLLLPVPSLKEQVLIARILNDSETAIHETEAIIAKLSSVKQGLLHDLLTRGIAASGELRPPQTEAPDLYQPSPLGWIPREWGVNQLSELLADVDPAMRSGPFGSALLKQELVEVGLPLLGIDNVHTERFVAEYTRLVTPRKFAQLERYAVRPDDLMITIMGTVGRCCLVPKDIGHALSSKHTWTISLNQDAYSPYLAMMQVNYSPWVLGHFARDQQGGTMAAIRSETLRSTRLPTPPREEQRLMEDRLRELSKRIDLEVDTLAKRHAERAGLMDDLLTGSVRVSPLLVEAAAQQQGSA